MVRRTSAACAAGAAVAVGVGAGTGALRVGLALAAGLLLGALNGLLVERSLGSPVGFGAASLGRLGLLSAAGLGVGLLIGPSVAPLTLVGLAVAQVALTVVAGWGLLRA